MSWLGYITRIQHNFLHVMHRLLPSSLWHLLIARGFLWNHPWQFPSSPGAPEGFMRVSSCPCAPLGSSSAAGSRRIRRRYGYHLWLEHWMDHWSPDPWAGGTRKQQFHPPRGSRDPLVRLTRSGKYTLPGIKQSLVRRHGWREPIISLEPQYSLSRIQLCHVDVSVRVGDPQTAWAEQLEISAPGTGNLPSPRGCL